MTSRHTHITDLNPEVMITWRSTISDEAIGYKVHGRMKCLDEHPSTMVL